MKRFLILFALLALMVVPASAVYSMMSDIDHVNLIGGSCSGAENGSSIANSYDGDETTWLQATNCGLAPYFAHNWTVDYCHYRYDGIGTATKHWELYWSGYTASPNSTTLTKDAGYGAISPKNDSTTYNPLVVTGQYLAGNPGDTSRWYISEWECFGTSTEVPAPAPVANFTGTPTSGAAPLYVSFDDASTNETGTCTYNWTLTPASGIAAGATGTLENHAASFTVPGNYTVSHGVSCEGGSNISTKTDYIIVYNATTDYITTHFVVMDEPRWAQLAGSTINMLDIENNSWVNVSSSATGYEGITTLNNHTISAFASMTGYNDDELLAQPAWSGGDYRLLLFPENYGNVSAGNVTVYVSVYDTDLSSNEGRVADAAVNMAYVSGSDRVNDYRITDDAGMVSFVVPNQTTIYLYAEKAGYTRGGTTISSGNGNGGSAAVYAEITIGRTSVTTAPTVTTLPGGGTPAPTVDPYPCDADHPENCKRKQTEMGNTLIQYGPQLLLLFIIATFVGVIKMMGK